MRDKPQEERKPEYAKDRFDAEFAPHDDEGNGAQDDVDRQIGDRDGDAGEVLDFGADAAETTADEAVRDDEDVPCTAIHRKPDHYPKGLLRVVPNLLFQFRTQFEPLLCE